MREAERLLLNLSIEFAAARETMAAAQAFACYLKDRFGYKVEQIEFSPESKELKAFRPEEIFCTLEGNRFFQLPLPVPIFFRVTGGEDPDFTAYEKESLTKIIKFFKENMQMMADLKGLTYTDDLTGLYNQRYLEVILERELSLSKRNEIEFSVLFLDLDHFKNVNDSYGHLIGSRLLYEVGQEIKRALRESDVTFRYGGDEFVVILSHTNLEDAILVAERIRLQIEKKRFLAKDGLDVRLTASIGVANVPMHAATKQQILQAADEALYGVKKAVRNKVIAATRPFKD